MRNALWFLALFAIAVGVALFAGNNQGTVTLFWPPYRVDLSLNLVLLSLFAGFVLLYAALRGLALLLGLPAEARRWRSRHQERLQQQGLLDALSHLTAGRYTRARKAAQPAPNRRRPRQTVSWHLRICWPQNARTRCRIAVHARSMHDRPSP
jgi:HemY protein